MRIIFAAILGLIGLTLVGCTKSYGYHYRMTVDVEDSSGVHTGSSVVAINEIPGYGLDAARFPGMRGQATLVDLGNNRLLVVLLIDPTDLLLEHYHLPEDWRGGKDTSGLSRLKEQKGSFEFQDVDHIRAVTFGNPSDPATARLVDLDDLAGPFGPDTHLKRMSVEVTPDPVSTGLTKRLPWLLLGRNYIDGGYSSETSVDFRTSEFISGVR